MKRRKIPTLIAVLILVIGVAIGVMLINSRQIFKIGANTSYDPKDIRITNLTASSFTVSWITEKESLGLIRWGTHPSQLSKATFDQEEKSDFTHSVTVHNLSPERTYYFIIQSGNNRYDSSGIPWKVKTARKVTANSGTNLVSGTVTTKSGIPVKRALVYTVTSGGSMLSTLTSENGTWVMDISQTMNQTLDSYLKLDNKNSLVEITVQAGPLGIASAQTYPYLAKPLPSILLGESHDYKNFKDTDMHLVPVSEIQTPANSIPITSPRINTLTQTAGHSSFQASNSIQSLTLGVILFIISIAAVMLCSLIFIYLVQLENNNSIKHAR